MTTFVDKRTFETSNLKSARINLNKHLWPPGYFLNTKRNSEDWEEISLGKKLSCCQSVTRPNYPDQSLSSLSCSVKYKTSSSLSVVILVQLCASDDSTVAAIHQESFLSRLWLSFLPSDKPLLWLGLLLQPGMSQYCRPQQAQCHHHHPHPGVSATGGQPGQDDQPQLHLHHPPPPPLAWRGLPHPVLRHRVQGGDTAHLEDCLQQHQVAGNVLENISKINKTHNNVQHTFILFYKIDKFPLLRRRMEVVNI